MSNRQLTVIGIVLLFVVGLFAITSFRQEAQTAKPQQDEVTIVHKGQVTEKEREYSKEYKKIYFYRKGQKLSEISETSKRRGNTKEIGVIIGIPDIITVGDNQIPTASEFLSDLSCKADAIILGSAKRQEAHLTDDETFVYTEYDFSVQRVLKNNLGSPIEVNSTIQITRPGGLIKFDNQIIRAEDLSYEPLQKNKEYLLFLKFVPTTNGYVVSSPESDFILDNKSFKKLTKLASPEELTSKDSQSLLNDVSNSVLAGCRQNPVGGNQ